MTESIDFYKESSLEAGRSGTRNVNGLVALLLEMDEPERSSLLRALYDPKIPAKVIFRVLQKNGYSVSYDQVRRFVNAEAWIPPELRFEESHEPQ